LSNDVPFRTFLHGFFFIFILLPFIKVVRGPEESTREDNNLAQSVTHAMDQGALSGRSSHFTDHDDSVLDSTALGKRADHACLPAMPRLRPWPLDREARGLVSLQLGATSTGGKEDALLVVRDGLLTLHLLTLNLEEHNEHTRRLVAIPVEQVLVTLWPGYVDTLGLSLKSQPDTDIVCCCKDQTARNKWVAVLRRVNGVAFRRGDATRRSHRARGVSQSNSTA